MLGWILFRENKKNFSLVPLLFLFAAAIGFEAIQMVMPDRIFDLNDIWIRLSLRVWPVSSPVCDGSMGVKEVFRFSFKPRIFSIFSPGKPQAQILEELGESLILSDVSPDIVTRVIAAIRRKARGNPQRAEYLDWIRAEIGGGFSQNRSPALRPEGKRAGSGRGQWTAGRPQRPPSWRSSRSSGKRVLLCAADTLPGGWVDPDGPLGRKMDIPVIGGIRGKIRGPWCTRRCRFLRSRDFDVLIVDTAEANAEPGKSDAGAGKTDQDHPEIRSRPADRDVSGPGCRHRSECPGAGGKIQRISGITSVILAKIDGTAKGGAVVPSLTKMKLPILCLGLVKTSRTCRIFPRVILWKP